LAGKSRSIFFSSINCIDSTISIGQTSNAQRKTSNAHCRKGDKFCNQRRLHFDEEIRSSFPLRNRSRFHFASERKRSGRTNAANEVSAAGERYDDRASRDKRSWWPNRSFHDDRGSSFRTLRRSTGLRHLQRSNWLRRATGLETRPLRRFTFSRFGSSACHHCDRGVAFPSRLVRPEQQSNVRSKTRRKRWRGNAN